ncbi:MAG: quinone-dependent dihydroorotate dehydrogenase [Bacteroidales bacterium]|nr:quinone-dependent dihydroorotate dehydrogenase [Bacteroidales bacterium]
MYKRLRKYIFKTDPEAAHKFIVRLLKFSRFIPFSKSVMRRIFSYRDKSLERVVWGIKFKNPIGLAAGFDKNGEIVNELACFGFGFIEVGSVTPLPQSGNPKPRIFRLPLDGAMINRMGMNNVGATTVARNLQRPHSVPVGGNISKNTNTFNTDSPTDYERCFALIYEQVNYFAVNVSCPNVTNLTLLQDKEILEKIIDRLVNVRHSKAIYKPILLKLSPDLDYQQIDEIIDLARAKGIDGIIAVNTTTKREGLTTAAEKVEAIGSGGLSGVPLTQLAIEKVRYIHEKTEGALPIIGVGGIMTPEDAVNMLNAGASLIQIYTGFIYSGPAFVRQILKRLKQ